MQLGGILETVPSRCDSWFTECRVDRSQMLSPLVIALSVMLLAMSFPLRLPGQKVPSLASEYIRTDFTVEDGLPDNVVNVIFCADNGLLWVGTESGLATFDGRDFRGISLSYPGAPSQGAVHAFAKDANGDLWVGTNAGLVLIPHKDLEELNPVITTFIPLGEAKSDEIQALFVTHEGVLWVGTNHGLYRRDGGSFIQILRSASVAPLSERSNGKLLLRMQDGLFAFDGQKVSGHPEMGARFDVRDDEIFSLFQDRKGTLWYSTAKGVRREGEHPFVPLRPESIAHSAAFRTYEDAQGNIWLSTAKGTYRARGDQLDALAPGIGARCLYATRDGELWMGTNGSGLIHFKPRLVHMYTTNEGLPSDTVMTVLAAHDGKLWVGNNCGGLSSFDGKSFTNYSEKDGLANSCVWALAEDHNNDLWVGSYGGGLFQLHNGHFTQYLPAQGLASKIVFQITVARDNSLWIATPEGLSHLQQGHFTNYTTAQGLSSDRVLSVHQDREATIWAATQGGIDRLTEKGFELFTSHDTEEGPSAIRFSEDSIGDLYTAASPKGIGLIRNGRLIILDDDLNVMDMVESPNHDLWFSSKNGFLRVALNDLRQSVTDHDAPLDYEQFDGADGLNSIQSSAGTPNIAITPDRKLWVATVKGLGMVDLGKLPTSSHNPNVFLGEVTVERKRQPAGNELILPGGTHHVELHLAAVELGSPEKTRIQYRLDGVDSDWRDADVLRTAVYTTIPLGRHSFHVRATGSDGKWARAGIVYNVTQQPLLYQKGWFQAACAAFCVMLLWVIYLARVQHLVQQSRIMLETRLAEREHIARDLHDTFLQGIQAILLRFHTSTRQLPEDEPLRRVFEDVLDQSDQVMLQGRGLVSGLRVTSSDNNDLPIVFVMAGREFRALSNAIYNVIVSGETRRLNHSVQDEIVKIGREALFNSYRHAMATNIETELSYSSSLLRLRFRDDGKGIEEGVLADGNRAGHYGLPGMRERANKLGAKLDIYSRAGAGTEIDLQIPALIAYSRAARARGVRLHRFFGGKLYGRREDDSCSYRG